MRAEDSNVVLQEHPFVPRQVACGPAVGDDWDPLLGLGLGVYLCLQASVRSNPHVSWKRGVLREPGS